MGEGCASGGMRNKCPDLPFDERPKVSAGAAPKGDGFAGPQALWYQLRNERLANLSRYAARPTPLSQKIGAVFGNSCHGRSYQLFPFTQSGARGCGYATIIGGHGVTAKLKYSHESEARKHLESNVLQLSAAMAF
jgi:hypothetical protein